MATLKASGMPPWRALMTTSSFTRSSPRATRVTRFQPSTRTNSRILNGSEMKIGGSIIMPMHISVDATTRSMIRNGRKIRNPIWNAVLSSEIDEGRDQDVGRDVGPRVGLFELGEAGEQREVLRPRLVEHELAHRLLRALERRAPGRSSRRWSGSNASFLICVEGRRHHEDRQEQRDADEHLVGRRGGRAEAGADEAEDDDDAGEAGEREQRGRDQRQRADHQQQLDRVGAVRLHLITVRLRSSSMNRPRASPPTPAPSARASRPARALLEQAERARLRLRVGADRA